MPGLPFILQGRTNSIAWGITASLTDVSDLYNEKVVGDQYEVDGKLRDFKKYEYTIAVKGMEPEEFTVRETHRGPLLPSSIMKEATVLFSNKVPFPEDMSFDMSLAWAGFRSGESMFKICEMTRRDMDLF